MKNKLLKARLNRGLSQEEMADLIGMSQPNYCRREKGLKKISDLEWIKIAKELGVDKDDIYEPDDNIIISKSVKDNNSSDNHYFKVPNFVMDHIEFLKKENGELKEKIKKSGI
ncbi:helix-turn-helix transcriptional regulator [Flavobacterium zhairuonense]|uniref:helix-turn-helix transcriptional regulator n=1 Tax=Flavobacterium zhairuonense TaxID=2493631 RepID=UPI00104FB884|nr:helix-turn-helix transcriptional regulator [Flavobacterium zhairuonense]KAF2516806.1 helix-turn-helix transcriptional regulator [Flavobacterium zhairuonense]